MKWYCTVLSGIVWYYMVLSGNVWYCVVLYGIVYFPAKIASRIVRIWWLCSCWALILQTKPSPHKDTIVRKKESVKRNWWESYLKVDMAMVTLLSGGTNLILKPMKRNIIVWPICKDASRLSPPRPLPISPLPGGPYPLALIIPSVWLRILLILHSIKICIRVSPKLPY